MMKRRTRTRHIATVQSSSQWRNLEKESNLRLAVDHVKTLEAQLNSKETELATALSENQNLMGQCQELKEQKASLVTVLGNTKKQLNSERLERIDLEKKVKNLEEKMSFQKSAYENEIQETRKLYEIKLAELESGRQEGLENNLAIILQKVKEETEGQIQEFKNELTRIFNMRMENTQLYAEKTRTFAHAAREELMETKLRIDSLMLQLKQKQAQNSVLENQVRELEEALKCAHQRHQSLADEKAQEIRALRSQMDAHLEEHENLLDAKLALDMEISICRKILEGEEEKFKLSPRPASGGHSQGPVSTSQGFRRKKKRRQEALLREHSDGMWPVPCCSASGSVCVEEIDEGGNFVRLKNNSTEDQPLNGWILRSQLGNLSESIYKFPACLVLAAGQVITIWAAGAGMSPNPPTDLVWESQKTWGAGNLIKITLISANGDEISTLKTEHLPREGKGNSDLEGNQSSRLEESHQKNFEPDQGCLVM
ncbi:lamin-L(III)-like [Tachyglossus aculeatus]|uniref:lamin-L(III)-like n=1 Tax=Tachyglossus aculeatus TaxID=9261 RepID=UPI0018F505D6|nr:lamin-L(III)-like [Tachyglossus aculeatus]